MCISGSLSSDDRIFVHIFPAAEEVFLNLMSWNNGEKIIIIPNIFIDNLISCLIALRFFNLNFIYLRFIFDWSFNAHSLMSQKGLTRLAKKNHSPPTTNLLPCQREKPSAVNTSSLFCSLTSFSWLISAHWKPKGKEVI